MSFFCTCCKQCTLFWIQVLISTDTENHLIFLLQFTDGSAPTKNTQAHTPDELLGHTRARREKYKHQIDALVTKMLYILARRLISNSDLLCRGRICLGILAPRFFHSLSSSVPFHRNMAVFVARLPLSARAPFVQYRECVLFVFMHMNSIR